MDEAMGAASNLGSRKEETRRRIVETASRLFQEKGVDGVGVDEIMRESGLTHGGFYVHFASKEALVADACMCALEASASKWEGIAQILRDDEAFAQSLEVFLDGDISQNPACPLALLGPDVSRREQIQAAYAARLGKVIESFVGEMGDDRGYAILSFAAIVGATVLATQTSVDRALSAEILSTTRDELLKCRPEVAVPRKAKAANAP
jgi:TetR/AcrR family transcriptional repressor of nem operon